MKKQPIKKQHIAAIIGISLTTGTIATVIYASDKIMLKKALDNKVDINIRETLPKPLRNRIKESSTQNYGRLIKEGSFTNKTIFENRHHDNEDYIYQPKDPVNNIWIFGDSWGAGIKSNEASNKTIQRARQGKSSVRITGVTSYSPLLMNLAYRDRLKTISKHPEQIAIFIDQTDIGDDWCRYRPYVIRDKNGKLLGVTHNNRLNLSGGSALVSYYKLLGKINSGILYALSTRAHLISTQHMDLPGITGCNYSDLLPFQEGKEKSPNGSQISDYASYFEMNLRNFINEIHGNSPSSNIKLISHDWAQHHLPKNHKDYMPKNISSILRLIAADKAGVDHIHINARKHYNGAPLSEIFHYPGDKFSHLRDYSVLSNLIQKSF